MTEPTPTAPGQQPSEPGPQPAAPSGHRIRDVLSAALRDTAVGLVALAAVGSLVAGLLAGWPGVLGALLGAGIVAIFSGTTILSMLLTADAPLERAAAVVMAAWLGKVIVVGVLLAVLAGLDFYSRPALVVVLTVGVIGSAVLDYRAVSRHPTAYVEPAAR